MYKEFVTNRLYLRPTLEQDADLIYQLMNTSKFIKYVGDRNINSIEDAEKYIRTKMLPQLRTDGYSSYSLITKTGGEKIGTCGLYNRDGIDGVDIGSNNSPRPLQVEARASERLTRVTNGSQNNLERSILVPFWNVLG